MGLMKGSPLVWGDTADGPPPGTYPQYNYSDSVLSPDGKRIAVVYLRQGKAKSFRADHY